MMEENERLSIKEIHDFMRKATDTTELTNIGAMAVKAIERKEALQTLLYWYKVFAHVETDEIAKELVKVCEHAIDDFAFTDVQRF